jgi:HK97 family phage major capsid protein
MTSEEIITRMGEIEQRAAEIEATLETPEADLEALNEEARQLVTEKAQLEAQLDELRKAAEQAEEERKAVADGEGETKEIMEEEKKMTDLEIRNSAEYCEAYKHYIITGDDKECRSLLTTNASGDVPVPVMVENTVKHAWESNAFLSKVRKTAFRGNLKVPFEKSNSDAYVHTEGTTGLTEEDLQLGIVTLTPANIKKWIKISDEAVAMGGEAFVQYVYDELAQKIMEKLVSELVAKANAAPTSPSDTAIVIPKATEAPGVMTVQDAAAQLSEEATDICIALNPLTIQAFNAAFAAGNFAINPFDGVTVIKCSALPAYSSADTNAMYAIVGDLKAFQVNYPEGEGIVTKWDDLTYAEDDMVKIVARQYAGYGVTAPGRLVRLCKPAGGETT